MSPVKKKYVALAASGFAAYLIYSVIFFYYATNLSIQQGSVNYLVYSNLNLVILGFAIFYLLKAVSKRKAYGRDSPR
ncbi:MAG: hypothetical protein ACYCSO_08855 [Cuniculiplasma sp.]|jgi:hypothetical protein